MYAMSWEINSSIYKYESIQDNYSVDNFEEYDIDRDLSLDEIIEQEESELLELDGEVF